MDGGDDNQPYVASRSVLDEPRRSVLGVQAAEEERKRGVCMHHMGRGSRRLDSGERGRDRHVVCIWAGGRGSERGKQAVKIRERKHQTTYTILPAQSIELVLVQHPSLLGACRAVPPPRRERDRTCMTHAGPPPRQTRMQKTHACIGWGDRRAEGKRPSAIGFWLFTGDGGLLSRSRSKREGVADRSESPLCSQTNAQANASRNGWRSSSAPAARNSPRRPAAVRTYYLSGGGVNNTQAHKHVENVWAFQRGTDAPIRSLAFFKRALTWSTHVGGGGWTRRRRLRGRGHAHCLHKHSIS